MVLASWSHFGYSHPSANFGQASGTLVYDADDVANSSVEVTLPLSGLDTFVPKLDEHLRSADFFDAARYPTITFKSNMVHDMGGGKLMIMGDLTVHGVTRPVTLDATLNKAAFSPMFKADVIGFDATATIKRSDFGVGAYVPNVGDEIAIRITTDGPRPRRRNDRRASRFRARPGRDGLARQPAHLLVRALPRPALDGLRPAARDQRGPGRAGRRLRAAFAREHGNPQRGAVGGLAHRDSTGTDGVIRPAKCNG